jgi:diguanylate cyclase (GGDEF)-like protein
MQETLFDRFRPFKPYDLILALCMLLIVAPMSALEPMVRVAVVMAGITAFCVLDWVQRYVTVPTPLWQSLAIVSMNCVVIALLIHLHGAHQYSLAFAMLNAAFATVAFGQHAGFTAAVVSVALLANFERDSREPQTLLEWSLFLAILLTLVAILTRVNRMQRDALFDVVTRLRNHRYFQVRLREELSRSKRHNRPTALLLLDLDNFKRVNDAFGHAVGDQVLRQIGQLLVDNARGADVICRYGGEELAVILPETPLADAAQVAERFRLAVEKRQDERGSKVTVSAGVAAFPDHASDADGLIAAADAAMYRAKRAGKNQVAIAEPQPQMTSVETNAQTE